MNLGLKSKTALVSGSEVADVVAFVASAEAVTINGSAVRAEGGVIRSIF